VEDLTNDPGYWIYQIDRDIEGLKKALQKRHLEEMLNDVKDKMEEIKENESERL